ncbi:MAG: substrate-binding domain-containing protein [Xanthobacteraceae bacterium]|nr:substrate-binding domain-containing protein [Xanthobacteraceae bacterium]
MLVLTFSSTQTNAQQKIMVDGAGATAPLVAALGKAFAAKSGIAVEVGKGLDPKARFEALAGAKIDIAMASLGLKVDEVTRRGMTVHTIARTPIVFAVHESVKVDGLTQVQLCAIYEGKHRNWKDVGGSDMAIAAHSRSDADGDVVVVRDSIACLKTLKFADSVKVMLPGSAHYAAMGTALAGTPGAIGMTGTSVVEQSKGKLKAIALDGVAANEANVAAGRYRLTRDAFLVTRNAPSAPVKAFIDFVKSAEGAQVIRANGATAVTQ